MLKTDRRALWMPQTMPGEQVYHYRIGSGGYNVRPVALRMYDDEARMMKTVPCWALFKSCNRVHDVMPRDDREACIEQAEYWMLESGIVK